MNNSYAQILAGRLTLLAMLAARGIPIELRAVIAAAWSLGEFRRLDRRRRAGLEFSLEGDRFYGPGY